MKKNKIEKRIKKLEVILDLYERLEDIIKAEEFDAQCYETKIQREFIELAESLNEKKIEKDYYIDGERKKLRECKLKIAEANKIKAQLEKMA